jgi:hypothetical protein
METSKQNTIPVFFAFNDNYAFPAEKQQIPKTERFAISIFVRENGKNRKTDHF